MNCPSCEELLFNEEEAGFRIPVGAVGLCHTCGTVLICTEPGRAVVASVAKLAAIDPRLYREAARKFGPKIKEIQAKKAKSWN